MFELSIIIPTFNRARLLARCIAATRNATTADAEVIVINGASNDGSPQLLARAAEILGERLKIIHEPAREGFVRAVNKGFRAARGKFMTWLNDDARPLQGSFDLAMRQLSSSPDSVGMAALFHASRATRNIAFTAEHLGKPFRLMHVRGTLYANFGVARRSLFERLGYFDERYYLNAADPDFSLKVWNAGLAVTPAFGAMIDHDETQDERRAADESRAEQDNARLFEKWHLPERNPHLNDFDPLHPCTLRGLRGARAA